MQRLPRERLPGRLEYTEGSFADTLTLRLSCMLMAT